MAEIVLSNRLVATVDDEDHARIAAHAWQALRTPRGCFYARRNTRNGGKQRTILMHREVLGVSDKGVEVDHIDGNTLDNRRANLRLCTCAENHRNYRRWKTGFSSQFKGVYWFKPCGRWRAQIQVNRKVNYLGYFDDERAAAEAYNDAAVRLHGAFACLNHLETAPRDIQG